MNIIFLPSSKNFLQNNFFNTKYSRDNCLEPFAKFKEYFEINHSINTFDINFNSLIDIVIVFRIDINFTNLMNIIKQDPAVKIIYLVTEERTICPFHTKEILSSNLFDLVLTWDDEIVDDKYFLKYNYPNPKLEVTTVVPFENKKLITMINGFKFSKHNKEGELYNKRFEIAEYFGDKEFDLYGVGWEKSKSKKIGNCYKGLVDSKNKTMKQYKFAICFENTSNEYGAITEKIFDCFAAGCVPIYFGAPNVTDYIPKNCFIDYRDFNDFDKLYNFLSKIKENKYNQYILAIKEFMLSNKYDDFNSIGYIRYMENAINKVQKLPIKKRSILSLKIEWVKNMLLNAKLFWGGYGLKMWFRVIFS